MTKILTLKELLNKHDTRAVDMYVNYVSRLKSELNKDGSKKNSWAVKSGDDRFAYYFEKAYNQSRLYIDGENITLQSTGISYNYQAYKRVLLREFPETQIDFAIVYKDEEFKFSKSKSIDDYAKVEYNHVINPFADLKQALGAYCVIRNRRGEFLTTMTWEEVKKHKETAKTKYIWDSWEKEMTFKTIIKKACKFHFYDSFEEIENEDNQNYDLEPKERTIEEVLKENLNMKYSDEDSEKANQQMLDKIKNSQNYDDLEKNWNVAYKYRKGYGDFFKTIEIEYINRKEDITRENNKRNGDLV